MGDLSEEIVEWFCRRSTANPPERYAMDSTSFEALQLRLGKQYMFMHHGDCVHSLVFTSCWLAHAETDVRRSVYPMLVWQAKDDAPKCHVCERSAAAWEIHSDVLADTSPCLLCQQCRYEWHYASEADGGHALR